jgi:hypothetical protein
MKRIPDLAGRMKVMRLALPVLFVFVLGPGAGIARAQPEASRVRILLLSDRSGNDQERKRRAITLNRLRSVLRKTLRKQGLGRRYTIDVFADGRLTPQRVLNYYRNLRTGPSEALVFYANAHGGTKPQRGLALSLGGKPLFRADLRVAMTRKRPRLAVILTDTCAGLPGRRAPNVKVSPSKRLPRRPGNGDGRVLRQLFFQHQGVVQINAAKKGYSSWGNTKVGDYFTLALGNLMEQPISRFDRNKDGFVEWWEFYPVLNGEARRVSREHGIYQPASAVALGRRATTPLRRASSVGWRPPARSAR